MDYFDKDFELRRVIFGLSAILKTPKNMIAAQMIGAFVAFDVCYQETPMLETISELYRAISIVFERFGAFWAHFVRFWPILNVF